MGRLQDLYVKKVINYLDHRGYWMVKQAWNTPKPPSTGIETGNQRDAYGYGIYYNKQLVKIGYPEEMIATEPHKDKYGGESYGREWIFDFLANEFVPETDGFYLVVANAAPYSVAQEQGLTATGKKYKIISQIWGMMLREQKQIKGSEISAFNISVSGRVGGRRGRPKGSKNRK